MNSGTSPNIEDLVKCRPDLSQEIDKLTDYGLEMLGTMFALYCGDNVLEPHNLMCGSVTLSPFEFTNIVPILMNLGSGSAETLLALLLKLSQPGMIWSDFFQMSVQPYPLFYTQIIPNIGEVVFIL
jgi:hypothetical protein